MSDPRGDYYVLWQSIREWSYARNSNQQEACYDNVNAELDRLLTDAYGEGRKDQLEEMKQGETT